jgi:hypothetical protein
MTISTSKTVYIDLEAKRNDQFYFPFQVLDDNSSPVDYSVFTSAKLSLKQSENSTDALLSFTSTGATNTIDVSGKGQGNFIVQCDQLNIEAGTYLYDFEVRTSTKRVTPLSGKITVTQDITR